jgi:hypothetical protein
MGGGSSKTVGVMPMSLLLKRIDECMIPEERETIFDFFEMLDNKLKGKNPRVSTEFKECDGVKLVFKVFKSMLTDDVCATLCIQIFERCKTRVDVMMDFIQFGGLDILERTMKEHPKNKILMSETTKLLKATLIIGAKAAITEIVEETDALMICSHCQAALEHKKRLKSTSVVSEVKTPTPKDRIKRVLVFMGNYHDKAEVIQVGLDACCSFANNKDAPKAIGDTVFLDTVSLAMKTFPDNADIMWRSCYACTIVCGFSEENAAALCRNGVHEVLGRNFTNFQDEPRVQMSILWLFDAFLRWELGASRRRVWQSQLCMDLFFALQAKREKMLSKAIHADKYAPYKVVLPLSMRAFMRESGGEVLPEDIPVVGEVREFRKRRNFDETNKFGQMDDAAFKKGDEGLIDAKNEGDGKRDWEDKLTYGKRPDPPKKSHGSNKA